MRNKVKLQQSITKKLLVGLMLICTVFVITNTSLQISSQYYAAKEKVANEVKQFGESISKKLVVILYKSSDPANIKAILDEVKNNIYVVGATIENEQCQISSGYTNVNFNLAKRWHFFNTYKIPLMITTKFGSNISLGCLTLYSDNFVVFNYIKNNIVVYSIWGILQLLLLLVGIWVINYIAITSPLQNLINTICNLDLENLSSTTKIIKNASNDPLEINALIAYFNIMLDKLYNTKNNLLAMQERLIGIVNAMPSVIIAIDEHGKITDWNAHAAKITGLSATEVEGKVLSQIYPVYENYLALAKDAIIKNRIQKHTKHLRKVGQENRYFDVVAYPVLNNNCKGSVIRIDDVTSQVLLEDIMAQTEKMNSIGGLAAGVAHEINNPLGSIIQSGQNILRRLDPTIIKNTELAKQLDVNLDTIHKYAKESRILDFIHGIREAGKRAANIVNNLLQFTRTSNVQKEMNNISNIIDNAIELASVDYNLQKKVDFRHIKIIKDYTHNLPDIYCYAMEIEQVMLNIFKNAAYALRMVNREPVIHIKIWMEQDMLIIEIQDNGPGMNDEVEKKIFDPFFTTKPVGEGTGLGLSVSFNIIVEKHGGSFAVESTEDMGTKFIIVLPVISTTKENLKDYMQTVGVV